MEASVFTRPSINIGPRQHPEHFMLKFITNAIAGKSLPVYSDGSNVREWIYAADNCRALAPVRRKGDIGEIDNIGGHTEKTNLEVTEAIHDTVSIDGCPCLM